MRRIAVFLLASAFLVTAGCKQKPQPADTNTIGNATDRNTANGTSGTGEPVSPATQSATGTQSLATAPPEMTGTEVIHGAATATTSTISGPNSTTAEVETPTDTSATVKTATGAKVVDQKKKKH